MNQERCCAFATSYPSTYWRSCHVIVVGNVMTSGSTRARFASALKKAGAARVTSFVGARTP